MAKQTINIGSTANDGTGDPLRTAFNKTNENFTEIYDIANSAFSQANSGGDGGGLTANSAWSTANAAFNQANSVYLPSVTRLNVTHSGASAYLFDQYSGNNPTIKITAGETIAFNLNIGGHPFVIRESSGGTNYNTGLTHVSTTGTVSTDASAQGKVSGTLYWKVPAILAGNNYVYQCQAHSGMVGVFEIKESNGNPFNQNLNTSNNVTFNKVTANNVQFNNLTYADLPQSPNIIAGQRAFINDANLEAVENFGEVVGGGGANSVPVWSDGTNWRIG